MVTSVYSHFLCVVRQAAAFFTGLPRLWARLLTPVALQLLLPLHRFTTRTSEQASDPRAEALIEGELGFICASSRRGKTGRRMS